MSEKTFADLRAVFNQMDTDHSGTIDKSELKRALSQDTKKMDGIDDA